MEFIYRWNERLCCLVVLFASVGEVKEPNIGTRLKVVPRFVDDITRINDLSKGDFVGQSCLNPWCHEYNSQIWQFGVEIIPSLLLEISPQT